MEYLQLLLILQHVAVGGAALVGLAYFFRGSDSGVTFLGKEMKRWRVGTALLLITGSFALGYTIEDLAKGLIDTDRSLLTIAGLPVDKWVSDNLLKQFFRSDRLERFDAFFRPTPMTRDSDVTTSHFKRTD